MIITRTPFRITLGGGGTDLPAYYSKYGGFIFAGGIDKYMYININQSVVDDLIRLKYSETEIVEHVDELQHEIARESLRMMKITKGIEVVSFADIPAGTGLGSSSCYAVGLINALQNFKRKPISLKVLAEKTCKLEMDILNNPVGKQDQYMASFGGLTVLEIGKNGNVRVRSAKISSNTINGLNQSLLAFYTKKTRSAKKILAEQCNSVANDNKKVVESMHHIKEIGYQILDAAENGNITDIGHLFDKHWQYKKKISNKMSSPRFNKIYSIAKESGALGGKISGAGGGGFFVFYVEKNHHKFTELMKKLGLREMKYRFDFEGSKVLANFGGFTK